MFGSAAEPCLVLEQGSSCSAHQDDSRDDDDGDDKDENRSEIIMSSTRIQRSETFPSAAGTWDV